MDELLSVGVFYAHATVLGIVAGGHRWRQSVALVLAATALAFPFLAPADPAWARATLAIGAVWVLFRTVELAGGDRFSAGARIWHLVALYDTRRAKRERSRFDVPSFGRVLGYAALTAVGFWLALGIAATFGGLTHWLLRWGGAMLGIYAGLDAMAALIVFTNRMLGLVPPPIHDAPILSRTVSEFWSRRWNKIVSAWLCEHCLLPLARRRRPYLGLFAAFLTSGALHAYVTWVGAGARMALVMGAFFLLQFPMVTLERRLRVAAWPAPASRAWTLGWLAVTSPLFSEPLLRILERP